MNFIRSK